MISGDTMNQAMSHAGGDFLCVICRPQFYSSSFVCTLIDCGYLLILVKMLVE